MPRRSLAAALALTLGLGTALIGTVPAYAATIIVTSDADSGPGTLRQAVVDANAGDVIEFGSSVTLIELATPIFMAWVQADAFGRISTTVPVPSSFRPGQSHTLQALGQRSGTIANVLVTLKSALPPTGVEAAAPIVIGGAGLLLLGGLMVVTARRRKAA